MKISSFGHKLAFLSQHVFHFHILDDDTKKNFTNNLLRVSKFW